MNKAHVRLICLLITALCKVKTVCYSALAQCFDSSAKSDSCLRRTQRFFAKFDHSHDLVARFLYSLLPASGKKVLLIDRTNWKFGQTDINIFMLVIAHEGVAYPLMFTMPPKRGSSNFLEAWRGKNQIIFIYSHLLVQKDVRALQAYKARHLSQWCFSDYIVPFFHRHLTVDDGRFLILCLNFLTSYPNLTHYKSPYRIKDTFATVLD